MVLLKFRDLRATRLERTEKLEQLRALENGFRIKIVETEFSTLSVDTPTDIIKVENYIKELMTSIISRKAMTIPRISIMGISIFKSNHNINFLWSKQIFFQFLSFLFITVRLKNKKIIYLYYETVFQPSRLCENAKKRKKSMLLRGSPSRFTGIGMTVVIS